MAYSVCDIVIVVVIFINNVPYTSSVELKKTSVPVMSGAGSESSKRTGQQR